MIRSAKRLRLSGWLIGLILCFIWGNSLLPGEVSGAISDWVKGILAAIFPGDLPGVTTEGGLLRKIAHFCEFAALGMALCWRFAMEKRKTGWTILCGFCVACVDETIQMFVPGRGPSLKDVGIDTCGVTAGMILLLIGHSFIKKSKKLEDKSL